MPDSVHPAGHTLPPVILIVDDDPDYRALLRHNFQKLAWTVFDTGTAADTSTILLQQPVQLIVLDIVMPNIEGLETILSVKRVYPETKILAVSGADRASNYLQLARHFGADAALDKSAGTEPLLRLAHSLLGPSPSQPDLVSAVQQPGQRSPQ